MGRAEPCDSRPQDRRHSNEFKRTPASIHPTPARPMRLRGVAGGCKAPRKYIHYEFVDDYTGPGSQRSSFLHSYARNGSYGHVNVIYICVSK